MKNYDDTKDADTNEYREQAKQKANQTVKQQATGFNPDEVLNRAASAMIKANMTELKDIFSKAKSMLKGYDSQLTKLTDCKNIRKAELEVGDM